MTQSFLTRLTRRQRRWVVEQLRLETVGGGLLLVAAVIALIWANSPWADQYEALVDLQVGPAAIGLNLPLGVWAADGLLAIFFFVVGLELKHELVVGSLSKPSRAAVPIAAAIGGMVVPALIFVAVNATMAEGAPRGWGIPMATDIAFALAVLAVVGRRLPVALRAFLLTLAVVDDLGAITVIAVFYSENFSTIWFVTAIACFIAYAYAQRRRVTSPWLYVPLALFAWYAMHESGVHATVTGIMLGLLTRVRPDKDEKSPPADRLAHRIHPWSAALCVPLFAFFAAGVDFRSIGLATALVSPVAIGVMVGLVIGKPIGVLGTAWLVARFTRATLPKSIGWGDVAAIGLLAGMGFTVSLLITELAFEGNQTLLDEAKIAVLIASVLSAGLAAIALHRRKR
jgi:NhaA family Na+:H+ antiporter